MNMFSLEHCAHAQSIQFRGRWTWHDTYARAATLRNVNSFRDATQNMSEYTIYIYIHHHLFPSIKCANHRAHLLRVSVTLFTIGFLRNHLEIAHEDCLSFTFHWAKDTRNQFEASKCAHTFYSSANCSAYITLLMTSPIDRQFRLSSSSSPLTDSFFLSAWTNRIHLKPIF